MPRRRRRRMGDMTEIGHCNAGELVLTLGMSNSGDSGSVLKSINVV